MFLGGFMKILSFILLSFVMNTQARANHYCYITETVNLVQLPFEIRDQVQGIKKYPVDTWKDCYQHGIQAASAQEFNKSITVCQQGNCQDLTGPVFFKYFFWSEESLVTIEGQVTTYTWQFDKSIQRGDRRFFPDGSMFP
jgi:hypothetical protein